MSSNLLPASAVLVYDVGPVPSAVQPPAVPNPVYLRYSLEQVGLNPEQHRQLDLDWFQGGRNPNNRLKIKQPPKQVANAFILNYQAEQQGDPVPKLHAILSGAPRGVRDVPSLFIVDDPEGCVSVGQVSNSLQLHKLMNKFEVTSAQGTSSPFEWIHQLL